MTAAATPLVSSCAHCGTQIAPALLACPGCGRLVHAGELKELAALAAEAERDGRAKDALAAWRRALELLPPASAQHATISARVATLAASLPKRERDAALSKSWLAKQGAAGAALAALIWKLKVVLIFLVTKGQFLLLGLTKVSTLLSMFVYLGWSWKMFGGWGLAAGIVAGIYIHEMGHVAALERYGIKATAPMFIPGWGALILLKEHPASPAQDARTGLAGPLWGLAAAVASYAVFLLSRAPVWREIATWTGYINLFNLIPIWQLDGGRGFAALTRAQRWIATGAVGVLLALSRNALLIPILACAIFQALRGGADERDDGALALYIFLAIALTAMSLGHLAFLQY